MVRFRTWYLFHFYMFCTRVAFVQIWKMWPEGCERVTLCSNGVQAQSYREEGLSVFTRGLGTTLSRAFIVNGVIFASYELCMKALSSGCGQAEPVQISLAKDAT